jgi:hypothetical protein
LDSLIDLKSLSSFPSDFYLLPDVTSTLEAQFRLAEGPCDAWQLKKILN